MLRAPVVLDAPKSFFRGLLKEIAGKRQKNLSELVAEIDSQRQHGNLSSTIRLFVLDCYRTQRSESEVGHNGAHEMTAHAAHAYS